MISGIFVKILSVVLLISVAVVLVLGIGTLFKGGETSKKYSNKWKFEQFKNFCN